MRYKELVKTIHNILATCFYHIKFWIHQENIFKVKKISKPFVSKYPNRQQIGINIKQI